MNQKLVFAGTGLFLAGALLSPLVLRTPSAQKTPELQVGRYQLVAVGEGKAFAIDTATGTTWAWFPVSGWGQAAQLPDPMPAYMKPGK